MSGADGQAGGDDRAAPRAGGAIERANEGAAERAGEGAAERVNGEKRAVVLVSGGLDSATVLALARQQGFACHTLGVDYGQRHRAELDAAAQVAKALGAAQHKVVRLDLGGMGGSALTDSNIPVPEREVGDIPMPGRGAIDAAPTDPDIAVRSRGADDAAPTNPDIPMRLRGADDAASPDPGIPAPEPGASAPATDIPVTYVPARNTLLLALALGWAEVLEARHIFVGVNAVDYSGYPDCRPGFIRAFEALANVATKAGVEGRTFHLHTPLIEMTKGQIIATGLRLGVDYSQTVSCYQATPAGLACGRCDSCRLRRQGFADAGVADPTRYA